MENFTQTLTAPVLLGIAAAAVAALLFLIIVLRLHAFVALVLISLLTALATGLPTGGVIGVLTEGFGSTLASVALLVGLGAMLGRLVETSGGARVLAETLVARFGERRAPLALGIASLLFGFPIFFDAGLIVMLPVVFAVARRLNEPVLKYGLPAAGAFSVMHVFVPPHPGAVAAGNLLGADIGTLILVGLLVALPTWYLSCYLFVLWAGRRFPLPVPELLSGGPLSVEAPPNPPGAGTVIAILLLPLLLIFGNTGLNTLVTYNLVSADAAWVQTLRLVGNTPVALLISVLVAAVVLGTRRGRSRQAIERLLESSLGPIASVVLITGAGGMFGGVLRASGIGDAVAGSLQNLGIPLIAAAFLVAAVLRVAQGSATVALLTAAALVQPAVAAAGFNSVELAAMVVATAAGSVVLSHVNDSGFWLLGRLMNMDVPTTFKTWTVMETLIGLVGFALAWLILAVA
ncbi:GntP family gluconate:H+ symporter [Deinobacterium chartae]|uniref:GntP family gluconate:H+ symporter n=1 Tax=Deinobacterium chartae TaxID=521158 RepID=A0A841HXT4_9DEIO|nr:GntP family permease [Deinobacterium chartae]MBB6096605.1 GntP family gluconate:H+ symporter [Deinobacterium chartae]